MVVTIDPQENKDQHMKFYGEKSLKKLVTAHQIKMRLPSESAALRDLVITGLLVEDGR